MKLGWYWTTATSAFQHFTSSNLIQPSSPSYMLPSHATASRPRSTSKASMASRKLVPTPRQTPLQPHTYCATAVAWPSDATAGPDRDQPRLLCPPTRAAWAALWGRTIIWHHQTTDRPRARERLIYFHTRPEGPSLKMGCNLHALGKVQNKGVSAERPAAGQASGGAR